MNLAGAHITAVTITLDDWLNAGLTFELYKSDKKRGYLKTLGRAAYGKPVEIKWDSLKTARKQQIIEVIGDPAQKQVLGFEGYVEHDGEALAYFRAYRLEDGRPLNEQVIHEYYANACVLQAASNVYAMRLGKRRRASRPTRGVWDGIAESVNHMDRSQWPHTLPANPRRLKNRLDEFAAKGYPSLIHRGYGNQNRRKVTGNLERLLLCLYCMDTKPYVTYVHEFYHQFLGGVLEVTDMETGEIFQPEDFVDDNGKSISISDSTVWNYVNIPKNRRIVDKYRTDRMSYSSLHRPHAHRKPPEYSFSKISMDDRDLPRPMSDGRRVKAYYSYDVASGAVVGAAYSRKKDAVLFVDCMKDMFRFINRHGLAMPYEVEVEHHLVRNFRDGMMQAGTLFPFVRWCNPGNSQEKRAEHMNARKKLGTEKKLQAGIGRPFAKSEAHRIVQEKVFDENNDTYKRKTYSFEHLVADDMAANEIYNNSPHPNQKKYPGQTRMDVLLNNQNPELGQIDEVLLSRYVGETTRDAVNIYRNQYIKLNNAKYGLSHPDVIEKLSPNNTTVSPYWIPGEDGSIDQVYIFQNGVYVDTCHKIERFQEAEAEKTDRDREIFVEQQKYIARFDKTVKEASERITKVSVSKRKPAADDLQPEILTATPYGQDELTDDDFPDDVSYLGDYAKRAIDNL